MTWTVEIRLKARQKREELGFSSKQIVPADQLLAVLEETTGIARRLLPMGDSLLCSAEAALNLSMRAIFQDSSRSKEDQRFDAAHEYAHVFLHRGSVHCAADDLSTASLSEPSAIGPDRVEGYSPRQRRENEASAYAAELLLPQALLRRLFLEEGRTADQVAAFIGLSPALTLAQITEALLLPPLPDKPVPAAPPLAKPTELDPSQRAAAEISAGPLLLGAGPGTGKTKTLISRCRFLVHQKNVPAENILCLTFSNAAAQELRERMAQAEIGSGGAGPWVGTFHAFGLDLLKRFGRRIGLPADVKLIGKLDALTLLENNLSELHLDLLDSLSNPALHLSGILSQISRAKDELCLPDRYQSLCQAMQTSASEAAAEFAARPGKKLKKDQNAVDDLVLDAAKSQEVSRCYRLYEQLMRENGCVDYGDLLTKSVQLLETCPDVRTALQSQFPHVLADEYQDVNRACAHMIRLVAGDRAEGLWVVGDHRQSIYRFRGASSANMASFQRDYPQGQRLELAVNYRSRQPLVDCFGAVACALTPHSQESRFSTWIAQRGTDSAVTSPVLMAVSADAEGQASGIAAQILRLRPEYPYAQQAILCRTHGQAQSLVDLLTLHHLPVFYLGDLMERPEVKDLLCLLGLFSKEPGAGLLRVGAFPEYGLPRNEILVFLERLWAKKITVLTGLADLALWQGLSEAAQHGLKKLSGHLAHLQSFTHDPAELLRQYLFNQSRYLHDLMQPEEDTFLQTQKRLAVYQLYGLALAFEKRVILPKSSALAANRAEEFLIHLRRQSLAGERLQGTVPDGAAGFDAVQIMTVHKAKGLEFPVVYVPNLGAGQFPTRGRSDGLSEPPGMAAAAAQDDDEEEQCLFFVALSRARDHLVLSRAVANGKDREVKPSPLLSHIDGWLAHQPLAQVEWPAGKALSPAEEEPVFLESPLPVFACSALETYERCPRQYYYKHVRKLPDAFHDSGYPQFHRCVQQVLGWMEEEQAASRPVSSAAIQARLDDVWAAHGPLGHLHELKYKASAADMLHTAHGMQQGSQPYEASVLQAKLSNCRVSIRPDTVFHRQQDGPLTLARRLTGKPKDNDHTDKKLALLRCAASQTFPDLSCALELHYLADGQVKEILPPASDFQKKQEADRLKKYEQAAHGIQLSMFAASPASADECRTCAYALICPL